MGLRMSSHRRIFSRLRRREVQMERVVEAAKSTDQPIVLIDFVQFLYRNPLVSEKQFCLAFVRIFLSHNYGDSNDDGSIMSYGDLSNYKFSDITRDDISELVGALIVAMNAKLGKMELELRKVVRDTDGKEMIALVTEMMRTSRIKSKVELNDVEHSLIFEWINSMWTERNGGSELDTSDALDIGTSLRLDRPRISVIINYLLECGFFTNTGFGLDYRAMSELNPTNTGAFPLKMCSHCNRLVVVTRRRRTRQHDEVSHNGCTMEFSNPVPDEFAMIHVHYRIHGVAEVVRKYDQARLPRRNRRKRQVKRSKIAEAFEITTEDEDDFDKETWDDGEEGRYVPTATERILLDDFGLQY